MKWMLYAFESFNSLLLATYLVYIVILKYGFVCIYIQAFCVWFSCTFYILQNCAKCITVLLFRFEESFKLSCLYIRNSHIEKETRLYMYIYLSSLLGILFCIFKLTFHANFVNGIGWTKRLSVLKYARIVKTS